MNRTHMNAKTANHTALSGNVKLGSCRCGMHQKSEIEYQRAKLQEIVSDEITEEDAEAVIDAELPAECEIPEEIEEDSEQGAAVNMEPAEIAADPIVTEEIAADVPEEEETLSCEGGSCEIKKKTDLSRHRFADGAEAMEKATINTIALPVMGGVDCEPREVYYTAGDGTPKEVTLPAPLTAAFHPDSPSYRDARPALTDVTPPEPEPEPGPEPSGE